MEKERVIICGIIAVMESVGAVFFGLMIIGRDVCDTDPALIVSAISFLSAVIWSYLLVSKGKTEKKKPKNHRYLHDGIL